jgi:Flp pilus assembly protein TadD
VTVTIKGFGSGNDYSALSTGRVSISVSADPVGAPIFYRDVPLMTAPHTGPGSIQPLPTSALPLIKWQFRSIAEPTSHVVMQGVYTCANCHSFSADGKTLGLDLDGPQNDKGLYGLIPVSSHMTITNQDIVRWSSFLEKGSTERANKRFGFMSQLSPDGRYIVTSIAPPALKSSHDAVDPQFASGLLDRLFSTNYSHLDFTQVFYPTRGILAVYDRQAKTLRPLPGADDPDFVQTSAFWSPDSKYLIYSRARASDPYPKGAPKPEYANDPKEPQVQYDLYRVPLNDGHGGKAEPIRGASNNGMSNNFPKVTPDGKWIVFVQNKNGLLMRPDSKLYMVPFAGGKPRLMNCNLSRMNSWHTFSPNGHWMAFSSKAFSPYTRLMLTHIDANGNDTPPVMVENVTAFNRAVNIPEFVNIAPDGIQQIEPQAMDFYRVANKAYELMATNQIAEAIHEWHKALELNPDDANAHFSLATMLSASEMEPDAIKEYKSACALESTHSGWFAHLAVAQRNTGDPEGAEENYRKALELDPSNAAVVSDLGMLLVTKGKTDEGFERLRKAVEMAPDYDYVHSQYGGALQSTGKMSEAIPELRKAAELTPDAVELQFNLGYALCISGSCGDAVSVFEKAVQLSEGKDPMCLNGLAHAYDQTGRHAEALKAAQQALALALQAGDQQLATALQRDIEHYDSQPAAPAK